MLIDGLDREVAPESALKSKHKAIRSILGSNLADARSMIATLRGQPIKGENLQLAFQNLVERLGAGSAAPVSLEFGSEKIPAVSPTIQQELLRIAQEGINNAIKHANAKRIEVYLGMMIRMTYCLLFATMGSASTPIRRQNPAPELTLG